ncbi:acyltransferase family protein [Propylenella binzhouense]|nr:acyltransferase [Propylenella binzhouense]
MTMLSLGGRTVLEPFLDPQKNAFNLVRLVAALSVIVSHVFVVAGGSGTAQPLELVTPFTLGQHAVNVFFVISGLTVAASLDRSPDAFRFLANRALRIVPALMVYGLVFALVLGALVAVVPLADYYSDPATLAYPLAVLVLFSHAPAPDGVFATAPLAGMVNMSLWTIQYEILAYIGLAALFVTGLLRYGAVLLALVAGAAAALVGVEAAGIVGIWPGALHPPLFALCFLLGVAAYRWRSRIVLSPLVLLGFLGFAVLAGRTPIGPLAYVLLAAYGALLFGTLPAGALGRWTRHTDISYGTYIYGWPVQQMLVGFFPGWSMFALGLAGLVSAAAIGFLSWSLVEKRALALKRRFAPRRQQAAVAW